MSPGPTFDRVYAALKQQVLNGCWGPGAHLEPAAIGQDLSASITPVRDALHRLVGERLIEAPRHDGFWIPVVSEVRLRELYDWNGELLGLCLRRRSRPQPASDALRDASVSAPSLFLTIARAADNAELEQAVADNNDRLAPFRLAEDLVFEDASGELASLGLAIREGDATGLRRALAGYHKRRLRAAPLILTALRRRSERARTDDRAFPTA